MSQNPFHNQLLINSPMPMPQQPQVRRPPRGRATDLGASIRALVLGIIRCCITVTLILLGAVCLLLSAWAIGILAKALGI